MFALLFKRMLSLVAQSAAGSVVVCCSVTMGAVVTGAVTAAAGFCTMMRDATRRSPVPLYWMEIGLPGEIRSSVTGAPDSSTLVVCLVTT